MFCIALTGLTFDNPGNAVYIVDLLEKRLRENSWIVKDKYSTQRKKDYLNLHTDHIQSLDHHSQLNDQWRRGQNYCLY